MRIKKISLKNFKCFKEVDLSLSPLTLLTGANSSGKSSFLHSILGFLQTEYFPFYLSPNGKYVNMGSYEEIVFKHRTERQIEISGVIENQTEPGEDSRLEFTSRWDKNPVNDLPQLKYLQILGDQYDLRLFRENKYVLNLKIQSEEFDLSGLKKWFEEVENIKKAKKKTLSETLIDIQDAKFRDLDELFKNLKVHLPLSISGIDPALETFREADKTFNYIGSFRQTPERTYYQKAKSNFKVDVSGEGYIDQILEWEESNSPKFAQLNAIMQELELFSKIKSRKINGGRFELRVQTNEKGIMASLTDVGFGISQFLPIIVADLQLPDDAILAVSQPEMHLHPKIQATLGSYFVKQVKTKGKQYLVETHSEYLLNRIRLAIVKGDIFPNEVALYYFENSPNGTRIYKIDLTRDGQIKNAPEGFFDTYMMDTMEIAMNAAEDL